MNLSLEERINFAKIIAPEVLEEMSDEQLNQNIISGHRLVEHPDKYHLDDDNIKIVKLWLMIYESEFAKRNDIPSNFVEENTNQQEEIPTWLQKIKRFFKNSTEH